MEPLCRVILLSSGMSDFLEILDLHDFLVSEEKRPMYFFHLGRGVLIVKRQTQNT